MESTPDAGFRRRWFFRLAGVAIGAATGWLIPYLAWNHYPGDLHYLGAYGVSLAMLYAIGGIFGGLTAGDAFGSFRSRTGPVLLGEWSAVLTLFGSLAWLDRTIYQAYLQAASGSDYFDLGYQLQVTPLGQLALATLVGMTVFTLAFLLQQFVVVDKGADWASQRRRRAVAESLEVDLQTAAPDQRRHSVLTGTVTELFLPVEIVCEGDRVELRVDSGARGISWLFPADPAPPLTEVLLAGAGGKQLSENPHSYQIVDGSVRCELVYTRFELKVLRRFLKHAIEVAAVLHRGWSAERLAQLCGGDSPEPVRFKALEVVRDHFPTAPQTLAVMARVAGDPLQSPRMRLMALRFRGDDGELIRAALDPSEEPGVRAEALLLAVARSPDATLQEACFQVLAGRPSRDLLAAVATVAGKRRLIALAPQLLVLLEDPEPIVRRAAAEAFAAGPGLLHLGALAARLRLEPDPQTCGFLVRALAEYGGVESLAALREVEPSRVDVVDVLAAVRRIQSRSGGSAGSVTLAEVGSEAGAISIAAGAGQLSTVTRK